MRAIVPLRPWSLCLLLFSAVLVEAKAYTPYHQSKCRCHLFCNPTKTALQCDKGEQEGDYHTVATLRAGASGEPLRRLVWSKLFARELVAEFIGTFIIVSLGTGSVMSDIFGGAINGLFQVAAVWIIAVTLAISTTGHISGAHLNPSISIALAMFRPSLQFGWVKVLPYIVAQIAGATVASWINFLLYAPLIRSFELSHGIVRGTAQSIASAKAFGEYYLPPITTTTAFLAEAFGTALLAFVVFALTHPRNHKDVPQKAFVPALIGSFVGGLIVVIAPLTQAGFNPARDFGPRLVAYLAGWRTIAFQGWWVYVVAPIMGAPIGAFLADKVLHADPAC